MRWSLLPLVAALLLFSGVARADDAEALIARGLELREKGRDEEALGLFRQAQLKSPSPRARAQVALAEQALGLWVLAETDLVAALAAESDPWIVKNKGALEGALVVIRKHVGSLEVRGAERADVYIDGTKIGSGAGPYRVEAGRRVLEVRAPGKQPTSRAVELPPGGTARETVTLVAAPVVRADAAAPGVAPGPRHEDPGRGQRLLGWVFVGAGAAVLATGGAALLVRKAHVDDYNVSCPGVGVEQSPACQDQIDSARTWLTVAIVTLIAGGAAVVGGGVIIGTAPKAQVTVACGPLGCAGTF
ncbi:MAG: hypothetical protein KIT84_26115 [Labilithrix sp.]|nr:hypothetical protein [Labilithrix sp.]MCW5814531.1 hypothetical protein [Labilithrix sp.]